MHRLLIVLTMSFSLIIAPMAPSLLATRFLPLSGAAMACNNDACENALTTGTTSKVKTHARYSQRELQRLIFWQLVASGYVNAAQGYYALLTSMMRTNAMFVNFWAILARQFIQDVITLTTYQLALAQFSQAQYGARQPAAVSALSTYWSSEISLSKSFQRDAHMYLEMSKKTQKLAGFAHKKARADKGKIVKSASTARKKVSKHRRDITSEMAAFAKSGAKTEKSKLARKLADIAKMKKTLKDQTAKWNKLKKRAAEIQRSIAAHWREVASMQRELKSKKFGYDEIGYKSEMMNDVKNAVKVSRALNRNRRDVLKKMDAIQKSARALSRQIEKAETSLTKNARTFSLSVSIDF